MAWITELGQGALHDHAGDEMTKTAVALLVGACIAQTDTEICVERRGEIEEMLPIK